MIVLFIVPKTPDYLASCLWDGFQELLGEENVFDAVGCPWLHKSTANDGFVTYLPGPYRLGGIEVVCALGGTREGRLSNGLFDIFADLIVVHSSFNRDNNWTWLRRMIDRNLVRGGKVAYVEGWDAATQVCPSQGVVFDAVFRKEISPAVSYPYQPHHLTFAAPSRWILQDTEHFGRPLDVFFSGNPDACHPAHPVRWPMLGQVFRTRTTHHSVIASFGLGWEQYFGLLRSAKLALCPSGADDTDSLRTMEAVACGAVPVFVGYPPFVRDPWFDGTMSFSCTPETLADHLDEALRNDLAEKRRALLKHVREHHTTAARARKVLKILGMT